MNDHRDYRCMNGHSLKINGPTPAPPRCHCGALAIPEAADAVGFDPGTGKRTSPFEMLPRAYKNRSQY